MTDAEYDHPQFSAKALREFHQWSMDNVYDSQGEALRDGYERAFFALLGGA